MLDSFVANQMTFRIPSIPRSISYKSQTDAGEGKSVRNQSRAVKKKKQMLEYE